MLNRLFCWIGFKQKRQQSTQARVLVLESPFKKQGIFLKVFFYSICAGNAWSSSLLVLTKYFYL